MGVSYMLKKIVTISLLSLLLKVFAYSAPEWQSIGPEGCGRQGNGDVIEQNGRLFVVGAGELYQSDDRSETWYYQ